MLHCVTLAELALPCGPGNNFYFTSVVKCAISPHWLITLEGFMKAVSDSLPPRSPLQKIRFILCAAATILICAVASTASAQSTAGQAQTPAGGGVSSPLPAVAQIGPAREIKLAENTWFRFGAQVQLWFLAAQDRIQQPDGSEGSYAFDFYCRRCRLFATGSVFKNVFFNILFESAMGKADLTQPSTKANSIPQMLDAYGQVKFANEFWLSGGNILMPLTRNGLQPTTTYVSIDVANSSTSPILQGNSYVLRDTGIQANGFFVDNHVEYRLGVWQGSRQAGITGQSSASHNGPRVIAMVSANFWDTETGYVNGGHYYGTKKVLGVMGNFDYQKFRTAPPAIGGAGAGTDKNAYYGMSGAAFINYPLSGAASPKGGDEIVGLLQFGYYDGGLRTDAAGVPTNFGTYPAVLKQYNVVAEAGYYNHEGHFSVFGKYEMRKISDDYVAALKIGNNTWRAAGGLKYYLGWPANFMNFALQYERIQNSDALDTDQKGTNNITLQMQTLLY